jgi:hypothetical protein
MVAVALCAWTEHTVVRLPGVSLNNGPLVWLTPYDIACLALSMDNEADVGDSGTRDVISSFYEMVRKLPGLHDVHQHSDFHKATTGLLANPYFNYYEKLKLYTFLRILSAADAGSRSLP